MEYDKRYKPSCSSRAADGVLRGALVGLAWGIYLPSPVTLSLESLNPNNEPGERKCNNTRHSEIKRPAKEQGAEKKMNKIVEMYNPTKTNKFNIFAGWRLKPGSFLKLEPVYTSKGMLRNQLKEMTIASTPTLKNMGFSSVVFAGFLGTFSGVTCASGALTGSGSGHPVNVFIGGCTAGLLLTLGIRRPSVDLILTTSVGTGLLTAAIHMLVS
mmetsp:Transcript_1248/g.1600  ORF Transcript_1248/g.1600 Transcript_1248/m.1600 type:complete len:213 (+) Transcript_1248:63-701(+)